MGSNLMAVVFGFLFGLFLHRAGLTRYKNIVNVFLLREFTVLKFMLSAVVTGMTLIFLFRELGWLTLDQVNETYIAGNLIGGLVFGVGMAMAGFCPGTIVAGAGQGSLDYLVPGILGLLAGAIAFGATYQQVFVPIHKLGLIGSVSLDQLWNLNEWLLILLFFQMAILLFYLFEKKHV